MAAMFEPMKRQRAERAKVSIGGLRGELHVENFISRNILSLLLCEFWMEYTVFIPYTFCSIQDTLTLPEVFSWICIYKVVHKSLHTPGELVILLYSMHHF